MNLTPPNKFQNENASYINPHEKGMTHFTSASFNTIISPSHYLYYFKTLQENQDTKKLMEQKNLDRKIIVNFILQGKRKCCKTIDSVDFPMKIFQVKNLLSEVILMKKQLEDVKSEINIHDDNFEIKLNVANEIKKELQHALSKFNPQVIAHLQMALFERRKKREGIAKRKLKHSYLKKDVAKETHERHRLVDKLLNEKAKEVNAIKREESLKRQADVVLHKVRRKKFEAKKFLCTLSAISKLRQVRSHEELAKGGYCSRTVTDTFNNVINHFQEMWKMQLEHYQLEEKGLRVMLEGNTMPELNRAKSKHEVSLYQWEQAIFGGVMMSRRNEIFTASESNFASLINIRRKWDEYLVDVPTVMSSGIPSGWILPPETQDEKWLKLVKKQRS